MKKYPLIIPLIALLLVGCKEQELLKGLDQTQANEVVALLQQNNIHALKNEVSKEGYAISVKADDFSAAVDLMHTYNLPSKPRVEIAQMFPSDSLVSSPRAEKARLYSGIEQRLEQSLLNLQGIIAARVHVSYDLNSSESERKKAPVHLSSLITHDHALRDPTLLISDVKRFLKNSFNDVDYDNISVVLSASHETQRLPPTVPKANPNSVQNIIAVIALFLCTVFGVISFKLKKHRRFFDFLKKNTPSRTDRTKTAEEEARHAPLNPTHNRHDNTKA